MTVLAEDRVFVIVEAGVTNFGDPELARRQIDVAVAAGADAVKFQSWRTDSLVSRTVAERLAPELGYDWYARLEERRLDDGALRELQQYARERGILFFATPHDVESLRFLVDHLAVPLLKIGSGESANVRFVKEVGAAGLPVLVSFGLQDDDEVRRTMDVLTEAGAPEVVPFHCVTLYPTPPELARLDRIGRLRELLGTPVGISDHSVGWQIPLAAVALGARAIEKHLTFDKADPRSLDNPGALEPEEFASMVKHVRDVEAALEPVSDEAYAEAVAESRAWATQAIVAARTLEAGEVLSHASVALKRPAFGGIPATELESVIGRRLARRVPEDEQITEADLT